MSWRYVNFAGDTLKRAPGLSVFAGHKEYFRSFYGADYVGK